MMFRGRSKHTLDAKGRLAIPARFKDSLDERGSGYLVLTNHDSCLWAYAGEDWKAIEKKAADLPEFDQDVSTYLRYFISGATECQLKQGRITIPQYLREIAALDKEVVLVGQLRRFEIWDMAKWEAEFERSRRQFPQASQSLREMGI
jgi:MraZ protein